MRTYGLIGYPLSHSFSRQYFIEKFAKENILDAEFKNFELPDIKAFENLFKEEPGLQGFAITIPYKKSIIPYLNNASEEVRQTGACNCVRVKNGILAGYNTDVTGFEKSFLQHLKNHHKNALVLGTGGAAAAVEFVLKKLDINYQNVSRKKTAASISYEEINADKIDEYKIIINCTPLGTFPNIQEYPPLPYDFITPLHYCYDLVYNPPLTKFLELSAGHGAVIQNGYDMLTRQAEENWLLWNK
ncbi:MAG: aroE [Chitinophagaceae bacterium]|nr:aroE [Chitinophagaceae bacterium]